MNVNRIFRDAIVERARCGGKGYYIVPADCKGCPDCKPRCKDLVGRECKLLRNIQVCSGAIHMKNSEWAIESTWRGRFTLVRGRPMMPERIGHCGRTDFELVPRG